MRISALATALALGITAMAACSEQSSTGPRPTPGFQRASNASPADAGVGAVFVSTNGASGNAVVAFTRHADGSLTPAGTFATGGTGTGGTVDPLTSEGALVLGSGNQRLYVVNAGSNSVSTFAVSPDGALRLLGVVDSRGARPVSLAVAGDRLFVLNAGDNSVAGFELRAGLPEAIPGAHVTLGAPADAPSTIVAARNGRYVYVTQRSANAIDVVSVGARGELGGVTRRPSSGTTPFGFAVTNRGQLIVSEAAGDAPNGAVSSYAADRPSGALSLVTASLSTEQGATCWLVLSADGRLAYAANAASGSITGFAVAADGTLRRLSADGRTGVTSASDATPIDLGMARDGRYLYVLETGIGAIGAFSIGPDGALNALPDTPGLAAKAGYQGLATF